MYVLFQYHSSAIILYLQHDGILSIILQNKEWKS